MDSYGIHSAQLQGNSMANYVNAYNDKVRAHKQGALKTYQSAVGDVKTDKELLDAHLGGMTAFDGLNGLHGAYQSYKASQKFGGIGNALVMNTKANLHQMTGGKIGLPAMGPNEASARGVEQSGAGDYLKSMGASVKRSGAVGTSAQRTQQFEDYAEARQPAQAQAVGHVTEDVAEGQQKDVAMGIGWEKEGAQTDPAKSLKALGEEAKVGEGEEGLGLQAKIVKKGLKSVGVSTGVAHSLGAVSGAVTSGVMGVEEAVSEFGDKGAKFKAEDTEQKIGTGFDEASDILGVADTFMPELTPISALVGGLGAVFDLLGGEKKESQKRTTALGAYSGAQAEKTISAPNVKTTTATTTGLTSLQKVGGVSKSSAY